jgi:hypothetical protein
MRVGSHSQPDCLRAGQCTLGPQKMGQPAPADISQLLTALTPALSQLHNGHQGMATDQASSRASHGPPGKLSHVGAPAPIAVQAELQREVVMPAKQAAHHNRSPAGSVWDGVGDMFAKLASAGSGGDHGDRQHGRPGSSTVQSSAVSASTTASAAAASAAATQAPGVQAVVGARGAKWVSGCETHTVPGPLRHQSPAPSASSTCKPVASPTSAAPASQEKPTTRVPCDRAGPQAQTQRECSTSSGKSGQRSVPLVAPRFQARPNGDRAPPPVGSVRSPASSPKRARSHDVARDASPMVRKVAADRLCDSRSSGVAADGGGARRAAKPSASPAAQCSRLDTGCTSYEKWSRERAAAALARRQAAARQQSVPSPGKSRPVAHGTQVHRSAACASRWQRERELGLRIGRQRGAPLCRAGGHGGFRRPRSPPAYPGRSGSAHADHSLPADQDLFGF